MFEKENVFFTPALPLESVLDPTGAGDSFAGGFMGYISQTDDITFENMKKAVVFGSIMASFCVEKFGFEQLQNVTTQMINCRLKKFVDLVKTDLNSI